MEWWIVVGIPAIGTLAGVFVKKYGSERLKAKWGKVVEGWKRITSRK